MAGLQEAELSEDQMSDIRKMFDDVNSPGDFVNVIESMMMDLIGHGDSSDHKEEHMSE